MNEELKKMRESLATIQKQIEAAKPKPIDPKEPDADDKFNNLHKSVMDMHNNMSAALNAMRNYMYAMEDDSYARHSNFVNKHQNGHLPAITSAGKMEKALKALGMSEDYAVAKPTIYCSGSTKRGLIEVEFGKTKE